MASTCCDCHYPLDPKNQRIESAHKHYKSTTRCTRLQVAEKPIIMSLLLWSFTCWMMVQAVSSLLIQPKTWIWNGHSIAYDLAQSESKPESQSQSQYNSKISSSSSSDNSINSINSNNNNNNNNNNHNHNILLLNGFGVGSFHQHRLITALLSSNDQTNNCIIYAVDYLGQGNSWPINCHDGNSFHEQGLHYSADTWLDQLDDFISTVIGTTEDSLLTIVGNSLGGYLAVALAHRQTHSINSLVLLNATPVWGLNLPGWSGHLPPPYVPRFIGRTIFDWIRNIKTIDKYLDTAYYHREAFQGTLPQQIQSCTQGNGGHAAFASILWSPPASGYNWFTKLSQLPCHCLLLFGAQDPWCTPAFAKKMLQSLPKKSNFAKRYLELDHVGHCPNHEAPQAVATAITKWMYASNKQTTALGCSTFSEPWGDIQMKEKNEQDISLTLLDWFAITFV